MFNIDTAKVAVIGLGYVGLPLSVEFGRLRPTLGFDINPLRIEELLQGHDLTREVDTHELAAATHLVVTNDVSTLPNYSVYIVTVPTPIDEFKRPDLTPLLQATKTIGKALSAGDVVIYESTVYPGATEEDCVPLLEQVSGLTFNKDFFVGYSPERINPGDREHRLPTIKKVTAGSTPETADFVDRLYGTIIKAGTYKAPSIRVAEAAKVIENTQRDVNIALINELAVIFDKMGIDTLEVLEAAGTKWNFLPFRPGLVGGHCVGVDPYYLTHKAQSLGYNPEVVLAGRRINDAMGSFVVNRLVRDMIEHGVKIKGSRALILGITFKENCPDTRNTRVIDIINEARTFGLSVDVYDPIASSQAVANEYGIELIDSPQDIYDAIVLTVSHDLFREILPNALVDWGHPKTVVYDLKGILPREVGARRL